MTTTLTLTLLLFSVRGHAEQECSAQDFLDTELPTCGDNRVLTDQLSIHPNELDSMQERLTQSGVRPSDEIMQPMKNAAEMIHSASEQSQSHEFEIYKKNILAKVKKDLEKEGYTYNTDVFSSLAEGAKSEAEPYGATRILVFISASIPDAALRRLLVAYEGTPTVFVLRGMVGDDPTKFRPTQDWVQSLICPRGPKKDCFTTPIDVNPTLFRSFGVHDVPVVAYLPDTELLAACGQTEFSNDKKSKILMYTGDMAPAYIFQEMQRYSPNDPILAGLAAKIRSSSVMSSEK